MIYWFLLKSPFSKITIKHYGSNINIATITLISYIAITILEWIFFNGLQWQKAVEWIFYWSRRTITIPRNCFKNHSSLVYFCTFYDFLYLLCHLLVLLLPEPWTGEYACGQILILKSRLWMIDIDRLILVFNNYLQITLLTLRIVIKVICK